MEISLYAVLNPSVPPSLSPSQNAALSTLLIRMRSAPMTFLLGVPGSGKTTILEAARERAGGSRLTARDFIAGLNSRHPHAIEEMFVALVDGALQKNPFVFIDDFDLLALPTRMLNAAPRPYFMQAALHALSSSAAALGKHVILAQSNSLYEQIEARCSVVTIPPFDIEDYTAIIRHWMGAERSIAIDIYQLFHSSSRLNAGQLRQACALVDEQAACTTDALIATIDERLLRSNVSLDEVSEIDFSDIRGADALIRSLETNVVFPMENGPLIRELGIRPRRGVLIHGPPGTGKTSIGRALAHRMKGKFFMIDGAFITEPPSTFFSKVRAVFEHARESSPAVIFIDDADVLFQTDHVYGLNRYLLTMLDGLESETSSNVCVIMTAMNVGHLPVALLRSGRIELWLETKLPDASARAAILAAYLEPYASIFCDADQRDTWGEMTDEFTGADIKRMVADALILYAYDQEHRQDEALLSERQGTYIARAAVEIRANKEQLTASGRISQ